MSQTVTVRETEHDDHAVADLADDLVRRLGEQDAQRVCRENSWYGVLRVIQGRQKDRIHA